MLLVILTILHFIYIVNVDKTEAHGNDHDTRTTHWTHRDGQHIYGLQRDVRVPPLPPPEKATSNSCSRHNKWSTLTIEAAIVDFDGLGNMLTADRILRRNGIRAQWFVPYFPFARHDRRNHIGDGV